VLLGPPDSGKTSVGEELGRLGFRFREWEVVILERWGTRAEFVANKATALPALQRDIRTWIEDDGARAVIESAASRPARGDGTSPTTSRAIVGSAANTRRRC